MPRAAPAAAADATDPSARIRGRLAAACCRCPAPSVAGVLPDDRADVMYHYYDGGGVTIDGPSLLVRKKFAEKYAVNASYYVDMVSSASIDVITTASPYKEERTQYGVGFEYLRGKVTYAAASATASENDYDADTASFSISQDMFGDLTTVRCSFQPRQGRRDAPRRRYVRATRSTATSTASMSRRSSPRS